MHMRYFGDSYDIVKMSLINWLQEFGDWSIHPMLTEATPESEIIAFERFLGARVISSEVLTPRTNRSSYFSCASDCGNLFLDPDTGLKIHNMNGLRAPEYLFASELACLMQLRANALTLIFDQSLPRGNERSSLHRKLNEFRRQGFHCIAYVSHACFILGSQNEALIQKALHHIIAESKLPENRFATPGSPDL